MFKSYSVAPVFLALLLLLLLSTQTLTLNHSVKHLFHPESELCSLFLQMEQSSNTLFFVAVVSSGKFPVVSDEVRLIVRVAQFYPLFFARAPPPLL
ncbi:MAG: hypothetical protein Q9N68_10125 [Gammaproteobacteria bacterium]|nr:hypothetical protein [Gammaproteobacteria bacterium]